MATQCVSYVKNFVVNDYYCLQKYQARSVWKYAVQNCSYSKVPETFTFHLSKLIAQLDQRLQSFAIAIIKSKYHQIADVRN
jgi:hypothetical protein